MRILLALLLLPFLAYAQEDVIQNEEMHYTVGQQGLTTSLNVLQAQITSATTRLLTIKGCHEQGMLFGPTPSGVEGCIPVIPTCQVPWSGATMEMGETITAYVSSSSPYGQPCISEVRTCDPATATLSGSYTHETCTVTSPLDCTLPWGTTVSSSVVTTAYKDATVPFGQTCVAEDLTCTNGIVSGTAVHKTCTVTAGTACTLPWGGSLNSGQSTTAYNAATVPYGQACATIAETRTCTNGTLSGSFAQQSCTVAAPTTCNLPWGGTIMNGASVSAYPASSMPYGSACSVQSRTCTNGTLSGSGNFQSCTVTAAANCNLPWGGQIAHGGGVMAYAASSVPFGQSCAAEARYCNNGSLSGSYGNSGCTVQPDPEPLCLSLNGADTYLCKGPVASFGLCVPSAFGSTLWGKPQYSHLCF